MIYVYMSVHLHFHILVSVVDIGRTNRIFRRGQRMILANEEKDILKYKRRAQHKIIYIYTIL